MICEACGAAIELGAWPFCHGDPTRHVPQAHSVIGDEIDETHEDLDPHGGVIRFRSRQEKQRYLDAHHLEPFVRHAGIHDQHVSRWVSVDLDAATALVSRHAPTADVTDVPCETFRYTVDVLP